ncbi:hypothetical protein MMC12_003328 [Toensbergia leucococca]|nr:hypothetical protein [Toensbergia leucococca]
MSSYLDAQIKTFNSNLTSSSGKISNKRAAPIPPTSSPSPAPSKASTSSKHNLKRKRPEPTNVVYSQPADTGTGRNMITQVSYAVEYLKTKGTPQTFQDLISYLSLQYKEDKYKQAMRQILRTHNKVEFRRINDKDPGTYSFRPVHNIRSGENLLGFLQQQSTAQGLSVRDLRDGWQGAEEAISLLEAQGKLFVTRNKKDNHAKMVWPNDPSLATTIDAEFQLMWHKIKLPEPAALIDELENASLVPANKSRAVKAKPKVQEKKTKKPRKSGKTTNNHMSGILRDYSGLKK